MVTGDAVVGLAEQLGVGAERLVSMYVPYVQAQAASSTAVAAAALVLSAALAAYGITCPLRAS